MQNRGKKILCTKEVDVDLLRLAADEGISIDCISFIETVALPEAILRSQLFPFSGLPISVVFTSANAVNSIASLGIDGSRWRIYYISGLTQRTVEHVFPKAAIAAAATNGKDLAVRILNDDSRDDKVLFCCGDRRRDEVPAMLAAAGIDIKEVVVYKTVLKPVAVSQDYEGYIFFSPSGVESFFDCNDMKQDATVFAIGETTAACLRERVKDVVVSEIPDTAFLIRKMISHYTADYKKI